MKRTIGGALLLLVVAACGGSSSESSSNSQTGMGFTAAALCALATPAEVGAAIGRSVPAGVPSGVNAPSCTWTASDAGGATIAATSPSTVGQVPFGLQGKAGAHTTAIPNLGDAAFYAGAGDFPQTELDVKKGGRALTITASWPSVTEPQQEAAELAIAKAAVGRM